MLFFMFCHGELPPVYYSAGSPEGSISSLRHGKAAPADPILEGFEFLVIVGVLAQVGIAFRFGISMVAFNSGEAGSHYSGFIFLVRAAEVGVLVNPCAGQQLNA
jgi:hypothetical protein